MMLFQFSMSLSLSPDSKKSAQKSTCSAALKETAAEEAMDEARKAGQVVPKYASQAATAVLRASIHGKSN